MGTWTARRAIYVCAAVLMTGVTVGFTLAGGLTTTTIHQSTSIFSVNLGGSTAFPTTPNVDDASMPPSVSGCGSSPVALASGGSASLYLPASTGIVCATGDFAVIFNFTSAANAAAGSYTFTEYTTYGTGPTSGSSAGGVTIGTTLTSAGKVAVYVDYGATAPPSGGIASLSLAVQ